MKCFAMTELLKQGRVVTTSARSNQGWWLLPRLRFDLDVVSVWCDRESIIGLKSRKTAPKQTKWSFTNFWMIGSKNETIRFAETHLGLELLRNGAACCQNSVVKSSRAVVLRSFNKLFKGSNWQHHSSGIFCACQATCQMRRMSVAMHLSNTFLLLIE